MSKLGCVALLSFVIGGCVGDPGAEGQEGPEGPAGTAGTPGTPGMEGPQGPVGPQFALPGVYTLANPSGANQIASYIRASNGNLSRSGRFDTGGAGLGAGLGSQGSLVFDARMQRFFSVNTGDNTISMLALDAAGNLGRMATMPSGGMRPISITVHDDLVYVVNQGQITGGTANASISGFKVQGASLVAIAGSTRPLSGTNDVRPTDIAFTPNGKFIVVAERFGNRLDTFEIVNGVAQAGNFQNSAGMQPFAFDFSPEGNLVVAEVGSGAANGSSVSSYAISATGALTPITSALPTGQTAACWLVMAGGYAYVANAGSGTITGVVVAENGTLTLHEPSGVTVATGSGAIDLAVAPDRGYLYSLAGAPRAIHIFAINADGALTAMAPLPNVPSTAAGLVAR